MTVIEGALDSSSDDQTTFSSWKFFRTLSFYFLPHREGVALVVLACSLETGFYWIVPLTFRHLIDNTLPANDRNGLILVLVVLCVAGAVASVSSLWRGRYWAGVEGQIEFDCMCAAPGCRKRVTGNDWRRPELQARYAGHFSPYLQRRITRLGKPPIGTKIPVRRAANALSEAGTLRDRRVWQAAGARRQSDADRARRAFLSRNACASGDAYTPEPCTGF